MNTLNRTLLEGGFSFPQDLKVAGYPGHLPERIIQFGEGNFLRAFVDWMVHRLNQNNLFNGRVVVVQPIKDGLADKINQQDGLYTLLLRGLKDGQPTEEKEIISSISRCLSPYTEWDAYLKCAEDPMIEYVVSNTTEAGIAFDANDQLANTPPTSFPGKLTAYLYRRFQHFQGDPAKGMVIIPCELIDRNGDNLKKAILQYASVWKLSGEFSRWIEESNYFLNTLVDRVVTGYPKGEIDTILASLGYEDGLVDTGELFHLWVIEGPQQLAERLPFHKVGLNVIWTDDMSPYRTRKVRILNGAHTASIPASFLYGLETVGEMMDHPVMGKFVRQVIYDEIIPSIDLDVKMLTEFADAVVERFKNPYIKHYLLSILLNSSSKFKTRDLPSLTEYYRRNRKLPDQLVFSLAALIAVYKDGVIEGENMRVKTVAGEFVFKDDLPVLRFFSSIWGDYRGDSLAATKVAEAALANTAIWGEDLTVVPGLAAKVAGYLLDITTNDIQAAVARVVK